MFVQSVSLSSVLTPPADFHKAPTFVTSNSARNHSWETKLYLHWNNFILCSLSINTSNLISVCHCSVLFYWHLLKLLNNFMKLLVSVQMVFVNTRTAGPLFGVWELTQLEIKIQLKKRDVWQFCMSCLWIHVCPNLNP